MKLHFLGQAYYTSSELIKTIPSEHTARFRGQSYTLSCPVKSSNKSQKGLRKYRGVVYSV